MAYRYPSGFEVGDRVRVVAGERKYNRGVIIPVGTQATVIDHPNPDNAPEDVVEVRLDGGASGSLGAHILEKLTPESPRDVPAVSNEKKTYQVTQIVPQNGYIGVWVEGEEKKTARRTTLNALGVASVKTVEYSDMARGEIARETTTTEVVGLILRDGQWVVAESTKGYRGAYRVGSRTGDWAKP